MTACKDSLSGKKAVSATLAGVLAVGMVPAVALADQAPADEAANDGVELLTVDKATDLSNGEITSAVDMEGTAIDLDDASFTLGDSANGFVAKQAKTGTGVTVDLTAEGTTTTVAYVAAQKDGSLDKNYKPSEKDSATFPKTAGTYYAIVKVTATEKTENAAYNGAWIAQKIVVAASSLEGAEAYEVNSKNADDLSDTTFTYNGKAQNIGFKVDGKAIAAKDIDVTYYDAKGEGSATAPTAAGDYIAVIKGKAGSDYNTSKNVQVKFTVEKLDLSTANIVVNDVKKTQGSTDMKTISIVSINGDTALNSAVSAKLTSGPDGTLYLGTLGAYTYTVSAPKVTENGVQVDNPNITGTATVTANLVENTDVTWSYGTGELADYSVNHSLKKNDTTKKIYKDDFDFSKVVAAPETPDADYETLDYTYTVTDKDGNEVDADNVKTAGEWTITFKVDSSKSEYKYGDTKQIKVTVTEGEIDGDASVYVTYNDELADGEVKATYDGTDVLGKVGITVKNGKTTLTEGTDYTVKVTKGGKEVDEVVNAGTYTVTVESDAYSFKKDTNTFTITVSPVDVTYVRVAGEKGGILPYTGEDIDVAIEYLANADEAVSFAADDADKKTPIIDDDKAEWKTLPAELYNLSYKWTSKDGKTKNKTVDAVNELGTYQIAISKIAKADKEGNYTFNATSVTTVVSKGAGFQDVPAKAWYYEVVNKAADNSLMNGYSSEIFGPNDTITRGQVACVLFNLAGGEADDSSNWYNEIEGYKSFDDVNGKMYYGKAIAWAKQTGVVNGYDDGTFRPDQTITREEFAAMLANYAKKVDLFTAPATDALSGMPDAASVSGWAKESVAWAVENGIMGNGGVVNASAKITRAETAAMVVNFAEANDLI